MAKNRMVNTRVWSDPRVLELDPSEKLLWIYLITNDHTNICGIYEIHPRVIAMEIGFDKDMIEKILARFTIDKKIRRYKNRIHLIKFTEHQANNPSVQKGIERELNELSEEVKNGLSNSDIQTVHRLGQLGPLNLTKLNLTKPNLTENRETLFNEFWNLYPYKKGKPKQSKYPHAEHESIMAGLNNQIKEYAAKKTLGEFVPQRRNGETRISKRTWEEYQDASEVEAVQFDSIYAEYVNDYGNNYAENWKKKYGVDHSEGSLFMRVKERYRSEGALSFK